MTPAGYAIWKHRLFTLTPAAAAEQVLSIMKDPVVLAGPDGLIVTVNQATHELLGYAKSELEGLEVETMFSDHETGGHSEPSFDACWMSMRRSAEASPGSSTTKSARILPD